jgi:tetratricopeptide (TPR) repeat protein
MEKCPSRKILRFKTNKSTLDISIFSEIHLLVIYKSSLKRLNEFSESRNALSSILINVFLILLLLIFSIRAAPDRASVDSANAVAREYIFSNINPAIRLYRNVIKEAREINYAEGEANALQHLGVALYLKGDYDESVEVYLQAIRLYESLQMMGELAYAYGELGYQMKRRDLERAKYYMRLGIHIAEAHNFQEKLSALYDNFGVLQEMSNKADSALYFYNKALQIKTTLNDSVGIPFTLNHLAGIYVIQDNFQKAAELLKESDRYRQKEEGNYGRIFNSMQWGDLYYYQGKLDSAESYYLRTIAMPGAMDQNLTISYCYNQLADIYEQRGDYKRAYENQKNFEAFKDSLVNFQTNERIAALEIEYETEKKDRLLAENQLKIAERNRQITLLVIGVIIVLTAGIVWVVRNRQSILVLRKRKISHYRLLELIGKGGMGEVFKAIDLNSKEIVALKLLSPELLQNQENRDRFLREGQLMKSFTHPNIVKTFEFGETEQQGYIAMEYLTGGTLQDYLKSAFPFSSSELKRLVQQICNGLQEIHNQGIIHRDIKTANIMLDGDKNIRIMDFGLSRSPLAATMTTMGTAMGTLGYVAPEQVTNVNVDHRADIFSLGAVLYELFTNQLPFTGENEMAMIHSIFNNVPQSPSSIQPEIGTGMDEIINRCLAKNPSERYSSVEELLESFLQNIKQKKVS